MLGVPEIGCRRVVCVVVLLVCLALLDRVDGRRVVVLLGYAQYVLAPSAGSLAGDDIGLS
jgi:uncharacterized membrane protein YcaP (DUF421 family)